ncbi:LCP family protein [Actinospica sp. MGRD01-02]|uniref:LCP family protein n=1 Tax=Actinospica acidithermotolerans TaxID=2828514 RepID=A0A941EGA9_9ACTN|nr:LCP family protein [Actinospica acidithermotolerans]MBR7830065.1 LCP family protein [Actinospica acidithermotolerans]
MSGYEPDDLMPEQSSTYGGLRGKKAKTPREDSGWFLPDGAGGDRPPRKRRRWGRIIGLTALGVVLALIITGVASWFWASGKLTHVGALTDYSGRPAQGVGTNWLLTGSDGRDTLSAAQQRELHTGSSSSITGARTDTIMILHYGSSGPDLISIPRDSYVAIPAYRDSKGAEHSASHNKINAAYDFGGAQLLVQTVEQNFGIRIDHYLEIGFLGIVNMVNEVGGVNMCLKSAIHDSKSGANLSAGCQTIDGTQALAFVRSRYSLPNSDISRMSDQQAFIKAVVAAADRPGVYLNPFTLYPFAGAVLNSIAADDGTGLSDLLDMASHAKPLGSSGGTSGTMPIANEGFFVSNIGDTVEIDKTRAAELIAAVNQDKAIPSGLLNHLG